MFEECNSLISLIVLSKCNNLNKRKDKKDDNFTLFHNSSVSSKEKFDKSKVKESNIFSNDGSSLLLSPISLNKDESNFLKSNEYINKNFLILNFIINNIISIYKIFYGCNSLISLLPDVSKWDTSNKNDMCFMDATFYYLCQIFQNRILQILLVNIK